MAEPVFRNQTPFECSPLFADWIDELQCISPAPNEAVDPVFPRAFKSEKVDLERLEYLALVDSPEIGPKKVPSKLHRPMAQTENSPRALCLEELALALVIKPVLRPEREPKIEFDSSPELLPPPAVQYRKRARDPSEEKWETDEPNPTKYRELTFRKKNVEEGLEHPPQLFSEPVANIFKKSIFLENVQEPEKSSCKGGKRLKKERGGFLNLPIKEELPMDFESNQANLKRKPASVLGGIS